MLETVQLLGVLIIVNRTNRQNSRISLQYRWNYELRRINIPHININANNAEQKNVRTQVNLIH